MPKKKSRVGNGQHLRTIRKIKREKHAREKIEQQKIQETALASGNANKKIQRSLNVIKKLKAKFNQLREGLIETVCSTIKNALNTNKSSCSTIYPGKDQNSKTFVCSICSKKFGTSLGLAIHQKQHANDSCKIKCHFCNHLFDNYTVMLTHYFDIHSFKADNEILSEELVYTEEERSLRELEFLDSRKCQGCLKPFPPSLKHYGIHVIAKHTDNQELLKYFSFSCSQCNTPYPSRGALENHWNTKCKEIWKQDKVESFFGIVCVKCGLRFTSDENLNFHREIVHGQNKELPLPEQGNSKKPTGLKTFICILCNKKFTSEDGVRKHQLTKHKKFICRVCGETVDSEKAIEHRKIHRKSVSTVYICDICGKSMKSYVSLYVHKRYIHGGEIYLCDICGLKCNNPYALKTHVLLHGDYKGYGCSLCEVRFKVAQDFYTHRRKHPNKIATILKFPKENSVPSNNIDRTKSDLSVTNSFEDLQGKIIDNHTTKQPESLTICPPPLLDVCPNTISSVGPSDSPEHDYIEDIDFNNDDDEIMPEYDNTQSVQSVANEGSINNNFSSIQPEFPNYPLPNSEKSNTTSTSISKQNLECSQATVTVQSDGSKNRHHLENCNEKMFTKNHDSISSIENTSGQSCLSVSSNSGSLNTIAEVISQNDSLFQSNKAAVPIVTNCEPEFCRNDSSLKSNITPHSLATQSNPEIDQKEFPFQNNKSPVSIPARSKPELDQKDLTIHANKQLISNVTHNESDISNEVFIKTEPIDEDIIIGPKYFPLDPFSPQLIVELKKLKRYRCIPCGKTIFYSSNSELRTHRITHRKDTLKIEKTLHEDSSDCESFSEDYKSEKKISRHKSTDRTETKRVEIKKTLDVVFRCSQCDAPFSTGTEVSNHCLKKHPDLKCFKCEICSKLYSTHRYVNKHKAVVHVRNGSRVLCKLCGKAFNSAYSCKKHFMNMHPDQPRERKFACDICGKMFLLAKYLQDHKIRHTDNKSFICEQCGKSYYASKQLKYHVETVHDKVTKYKEAKHQQWLKRKLELKMSGKKVQKKEPLFFCVLCPAKFIKERGFKNHLELHDPNRKYACDICGLRYKFPNNLISHINYVHKKNIEIDVAEKSACITNSEVAI